MHFKNKMLSTFLLLFVTQAFAEDLMCYVCKNCAKIDANTPLIACDESYFNQASSTEVATEAITTTAALESSSDSTTTASSTSTSTSTSTTTTATTAATPTTAAASTTSEILTTMPIMPTPGTVAPVQTTNSVPTPPQVNLSNNRTAANATNQTATAVTTPEPIGPVVEIAETAEPTSAAGNYTSSFNFRVREVRSLVFADYSYHCYAIHKQVSGASVTERGCLRINSSQAACEELQALTPDAHLSDCDACSMSKCNGSSAVAVSLVTLLFAFAVFALSHH